MKKVLLSKITKRVVYSILFFIVLSQLMTSCLQFRMKPDEVDAYFKDKSKVPELKRIASGNREISLAFQDNHQETTVVFIHGAPGSWSAFIDFMKNDDLRDQVNIISVDRPGYGYSGFGEPVYSLERQSKYLMKAVRAVSDKPLILVGHSLGGPVAARMMMDFPENIKGSVLVAPSIDPDLENREWYRYLGKLRLVKYLLPKSLWVTNEEIYDLKEELAIMLPGWSDITSKVIVIQGTKDNLVPKENADFADRVMADEFVEIRMLEDVNHFIPWTHPETIVNSIREIDENSTN
ncbi:MAG: alpha/beta hydrolase [Bacteroidota bacterium]